jgi:hypothetical protein
MGEPVYRLTGTVTGETFDGGRWRLTARMPAFDEAGWEGYYAADQTHGEQYGRIYLLAAGTGPELPRFPEDFAPRAVSA